MYKLDLEIDKKEFQAIERRRAREEERKSRIFDPHTRQFGKDLKALDEQIKEKKEREQREKERDELFDAMAIRNGKIAELMIQRQDEDRMAIKDALNEFRMLHQQAKDRREYDLYDPEAGKREIPPRLSDDDPRCTVSGCQKFDGEDLNHQARMDYQLAQKKQWLDAQIATKRQMEAKEKEAQRLYELKQVEMDTRMQELMQAETDCKLAIDAAVKNYNKALSEERKTREEVRRRNDDDDRLVHIANALQSDLMTENPAQAVSGFGPGRILPDRFKGMSPDQLDQIKKEQMRQIEEKKRMKDEEKRLEELHQQQSLLNAKKAKLLEREIDNLKLQQTNDLKAENLKLAKEHQAYMDYLEKEVYTNNPTADYFMQFNTCSR